MKRLIIIMLMTMSLFVMGEVVRNTDKPFKGKWDFKPEKLWGVNSYKTDSLAMVQRFEVGENGNVYIFDRRNFKFFVYDKNGKPIYKFGKRGEGPGEMKYMLDFYLVGNKIIVYDMGRVIYMDLKGKFLKNRLINSTIGIAPFLFLDEDRFLKSRTKLSPGAKPESLEVFDLNTKKSTYLVGEAPEPVKGSRRGVSIRLSIGNSRFERNPGFVVGKIGNQILWGKNSTYLITSSDLKGKENFSFSMEGRGREKIGLAYKKKMASGIRIRGGGDIEEIKKRYMKNIPDLCTYFSRITSDKNGLIYVYVSDAERENGQVIDIYSPKGKFLYQGEISLTGGNRIISKVVVFKGDHLYMVVEDDEGEFALNKYKIQLPKT